jgi:hypothetical protein
MKEKVRYVLIDSEDQIPPEARVESGDADASVIDLRLECLKLAVAFAKAKGPAPIAVAKEFVAFVLAKEPAAPESDSPPPDSRTRP